jgi:MFS family permease
VVTRPGVAELTKTIALGIGRLMGWSAAGYTFLVVMPSYLQTSLNATFQQALLATVLANVGFELTILPAGLLSDRIGRRAVMVTGVTLILLLALPLLNLLQNPDGALPVKGMAVLLAGAAVGLIAGPGPAMLSEMRVIGLMSGTSYDAIDAAAADLRLDGDTLVLAPLGMVSQSYPQGLRADLAAALPPAGTTWSRYAGWTPPSGKPSASSLKGRTPSCATAGPR